MTDELTILFTGTNPENYESYGQIVHIPMIAISPHQLSDEEKENLKVKFEDYDIILLTSKFAVVNLFNLTEDLGIDFSKVRTKVFVVIGHHTAEALRNKQIEPNLISNIETSEGLFEQMKEDFNLSGQRILFPRSSLSNPYLKDQLTGCGCEVDELTVYDNTTAEKKEVPDEVNAVLFTSPSTVYNFIAHYEAIPARWKILCKGPVTMKALGELGYRGEII